MLYFSNVDIKFNPTHVIVRNDMSVWNNNSKSNRNYHCGDTQIEVFKAVENLQV